MEFPKVDLLRVKPGDFVIVPPGAPLRRLTLASLVKLGISTGHTNRSANSYEAVGQAFATDVSETLPLVFLVTRTAERVVSQPYQHALAFISNTPAEVRVMDPPVRNATLKRVPLAGPVHPSLAQAIDTHAEIVVNSLNRRPSSFLLEADNDLYSGICPDVATVAAWLVCKNRVTREASDAAGRELPRKEWFEAGPRQDEPLEGSRFKHLVSEMWSQGSLSGAAKFPAVDVKAKFLCAAAKRGAIAVRDEHGAVRRWLARRAMQESAATVAANWELRARALVLFESVLKDDLKAARARALRWKAMARELGMPGDSRRVVQALEKAAMPEGR